MTPKRTLQVDNPRELGRLIRLARKNQHLRQDEVGRLSHSFIGEVETGKPTAQMGKVFAVLAELGLKLYVEVPADLDPNALVDSQADPV